MSLFDRKPFTWLVDPFILVCLGLGNVIVNFILYGFLGYGDNSFFRFGPPVEFLSTKIEGYGGYFLLLGTFFINSLLYASIYEVLQQWLYLEVQNKSVQLRYGIPKTLISVNFYNVYLILNSFYIVQSSSVQLSFMLSTLLAQIIATTYINIKFINEKKKFELPIVDPG